MSRMGTHAVCPYCGRETYVTCEANAQPKTELVRCPVDRGGCDELFAVSFQVTITAFTFRLCTAKECGHE